MRSPVWFGNLTTARRLWAMNSRISYMKSDSSFVYQETGSGIVPTAPAGAVSTFYRGATRRPYVSGELTLSWFPSDKISVVSSTSAQQNRMDGTASSLQLSTAAAAKNIFYFDYLDIARVSESIDTNYRITKWLGVSAAYQYTDRVVDQVLKRSGTTNSNAPGTLSNHLNAGTVGFRLKPLKHLSLNLDAGTGRDSGPYTPVSLANYHTLKGRVDYSLGNSGWRGDVPAALQPERPGALQLRLVALPGEISGSSSFEVRRKWWFDGTWSNIHRDTSALSGPNCR